MNKYSLNRRLRRLRRSATLRNQVAETQIHVDDLMLPIFLLGGSGQKRSIPSMPGIEKLSIDLMSIKIEHWMELGLRSFLLFGQIDSQKKDNTGKEAINPNGLIPTALNTFKKQFPDAIFMPDVALDPYSEYGHDGIVINGTVDNDQTLEVLAQQAVILAQSGADLVAPSDMMDGRVGVIRKALDAAGMDQTGILSYAAKYASGWYGPFRDALDSAPGMGDKKGYQMDYRNKREALIECQLDVEEGADILMIKPAGYYLDIIQQTRATYSLPIAAYQVSGEYGMIKAGAKNGWLNETDIMVESLYCIKRAGADLIATYFAPQMAEWLKSKKDG